MVLLCQVSADGISWLPDGAWNATLYGFASEETNATGMNHPTGVAGMFDADTGDVDADEATYTGIAVRGAFGARQKDE